MELANAAGKIEELLFASLFKFILVFCCLLRLMLIFICAGFLGYIQYVLSVMYPRGCRWGWIL